ncbi:alpha-L-fucosidase [Metabacillus arenae]|uniref:alpha-L-fucosidase n=1 Tax=Metabacillus arenae TaxID=2771434 RepID=UPI002963C8B5|nr:alpha-L-fucosidase [Metabacillus arenae]
MGDGTDSPEKFNPTSFDAKQWIKIAKNAGFKYFVLTAKHHDGFCLWPTETTDYSVKSSPWKNGEGDVVLECAKACQEEDMPFGVYISPWDRHEKCHPDKEKYDDFYCRQLTEILTQYCQLVEVWFDGAGSEGREYDWKRIIGLVKKYQPDAMIFNMGQPTIRWVGNEDGVAPYPWWNTRSNAKISMFSDDSVKWLPGTPNWLPAECDVSIRGNHWFWQENDESSLRSLDDLLSIYYCSVGHGTNLLLNVAPDNRGLIPEEEKKRVLEFGDEIRRRFSIPITVTEGTGSEIILELPFEAFVNTIVLQEDISGGERVRKYEIDSLREGQWSTIAEGTAIGHKRVQCFPLEKTKNLRFRAIETVGEPLILSFSCFNTTKK